MPTREIFQYVDLTGIPHRPVRRRTKQQALAQKRPTEEQKHLRAEQYQKEFGPNYLDGDGMSNAIALELDECIEVESYSAKVARTRAAVKESLRRLEDEYLNSHSLHLNDNIDGGGAGASSLNGTTLATIPDLSAPEDDYDQVLTIDLNISQEEIDSWDKSDDLSFLNITGSSYYLISWPSVRFSPPATLMLTPSMT